MYRSKISCGLVMSLAMLGVTAQAASADPPPKFEIGGLYSVHHNDVGTFPIGWVFAVGGNLTGGRSGEDKIMDLFLVGEISGGYKTLSEMGFDVTIREHTFLGGVKFASSASRSAVPFFQVLSGVGNFGAGFEGESASVNAFAFQTGGGVDVRMGARAALRVQGDYRMLRKDGENLNEFRFAVGVVFGFGKATP
jgi:hypothetical protein